MARGEAREETLTGVLIRITYRDPESGWTIARFCREGSDADVVVVGELGGATPGSRLQLIGSWTTHRVHGPQFRVARLEALRPDTREALARYLGSGLIKGLGPRLAERIVAHFGLSTLEVLDAAPGRLGEVPGLGPAKVAAVVQAWEAQRSVQALMLFLQAHDVPIGQASYLFEAFGPDAEAMLRRDPFSRGAGDRGLGFGAAERLAGLLGLPKDAPCRLEAGLRQVLAEAAADGHMALPRDWLLARAAAVTGLAAQRLEAPLARAIAREAVLEEDLGDGALIWSPASQATEARLAGRLRALLGRPPEVMPDVAARLARVEAAEALALAPEQREAVLTAAASRLFVLSGGPGTGKTTCVRALVRLLEELELVVRLASPTGRAARRLAEVTGREAATVHRLLGFQPAQGTFARGPRWPLEADVVLVDEASMLDAALAEALLQALPPLCQLILVGDAGQLPSVGPGQVLADMLACGNVPSRHLARVFRQAEQSAIVRNAHRIGRGELPELVVPTGEVRTDCYFLEARTPEEALSLVENAVARSLPARFGLDPLRDVQVLTPTNRGLLGAGSLNRRLKARLNPGGSPDAVVVRPGVGDRVIQLENDPDRQVFNGDLGVVEAVDEEAGVLRVRMAEGLVEHPLDASDALGLAWAITVHKSQGCEFPAVVLVLDASHGPMLQRRLLYTALTRARRVAVLVGERSAIARAVANDEAGKRITRLAARLRRGD